MLAPPLSYFLYVVIIVSMCVGVLHKCARWMCCVLMQNFLRGRINLLSSWGETVLDYLFPRGVGGLCEHYPSSELLGSRADMLAQWIKVPDAKSYNLNLIPGAHMVKGKNLPSQTVL